MPTDLLNSQQQDQDLPLELAPELPHEAQEGVVDALPVDGQGAAAAPAQSKPAERPLSPREEMMQQIAANSMAARQQEMMAAGDIPPGDTQKPQPTTEDADLISAAPDVLDLAQYGDRPVVLNVGGNKVTMSAQQLQRNAQILLAADKRMQDVAEREKRVKAQEDALANTQSNQPAENSTTQQGAESNQVDIASISDLLLDGDTDAANAAIQQLVSQQVQAIAGRGNAIPSADELANQVQTRLRENEAGAIVQREFADVVSDPVLSNLYAQQYHALAEVADPVERATQAASSVREWRNSLIPAPSTPSVTDARAQAKQAAASHAAPGGAAARNAAPTPKAAPTPSEIVAKLAAARGQHL